MVTLTNEERAWLRAPHVARNWFGAFDLPTGMIYLHNGVGRVTVGGQEYRGVSDPITGQLVSISAIEDPRFGQAPKVDIVLGPVSATGFKWWRDTAADIEGRSATLRFGVFDPETGASKLFKPLFPGKMSAPKLHRGPGPGTRFIGLSIESFWQSQNYPFGGRWTPADQRRRYPEDAGLDFVGVKVAEQWK